MVNAGVLAQNSAVTIDNRAAYCLGTDSLFLEVGLNELRVVAVGNKTDLLAIVLLRDRNAKLARKLAHLGFGVAAQREQSASKLRLREPEKKIGLIFCLVDTTA